MSTNKDNNIVSDDKDAQRREQQIFLRKFNDEFNKYKNIVKDKVKVDKENKLQELSKEENVVADDRCLTLNTREFIYTNVTLILGILFIFFAILIYFGNINYGEKKEQLPQKIELILPLNYKAEEK